MPECDSVTLTEKIKTLVVIAIINILLCVSIGEVRLSVMFDGGQLLTVHCIVSLSDSLTTGFIDRLSSLGGSKTCWDRENELK